MATIAAIETEYRGYQFRSRLEAKWACFFDLCGWKWSYEPIDCNGWIPDFALGETATLVEVKPILSPKDWTPVIDKIQKAVGETTPVLLLGADATWMMDWTTCGWSDAPRIGFLLNDCAWEDDHANHGEDERAVGVHFGWREDSTESLDLSPLNGNWGYIAGHVSPVGDRRGIKERVDLEKWEHGELSGRWAKACNTSKWIPTRAAK